MRWLDDPVESGRAAGFGIYVHVPFCSHRCGYCDFAVREVGGASSRRSELMTRYVRALLRRIRVNAPRHTDRQVTSVFIGGGTPTLLPPGELATIVATLRSEFDVAPDAEVTVECNPETASEEMFGALVEVGVERVSLGVQSTAPHVLATLERRHHADGAARAVRLARDAGIDRVSLDLIYGTPGETEADWQRTLEDALALVPEHISAYALTVHSNTPMGRAVAEGSLPAPDDDVQRGRWELAREVLDAAAFDHYEISNWARGPRQRSRHNLLYWRHGDYLAFGVGAHGHLDGYRWWHHRSVDRWLDAAEAGAVPIAGDEHLGTDERSAERLMLGLRLREGLHPHDVPPLDPASVQDAADAGLLLLTCGRFQATDDGWYLLDETVGRLVA
ncbi:MAG: radical SAM family heme chaperone HemW [Actinobacteria bacterium]|nr:radical SAM family heme chaperone HemW [Actinomycetota bacterium]